MGLFDGLFSSILDVWGVSSRDESKSKGSFQNFDQEKAELQGFKGRKQPGARPSPATPPEAAAAASDSSRPVAVATVNPHELRAVNSEFFNARRCQVWIQTAHARNFDLQLFFRYLEGDVSKELTSQVVEFIEAAEKAYDPSGGFAQARKSLSSGVI